jgi:organic radical activating enzyme
MAILACCRSARPGNGSTAMINRINQLYIDIVAACNLRCPSCIMGSVDWADSEFPKGKMSLAMLEAILDKARAELPVGRVHLYNWTEPMLHPELPELVRAVRSRGFECYLSSNLNRLTRPEDLMKAGVTNLRVSVSGFTNPVYKRGHKLGDIDIVKSNMKKISAARAAVGASTVFECHFHRYRYNRTEMVDMQAFAQSLGFVFTSAPAVFGTVEQTIGIRKGEDCISEEQKSYISTLSLPHKPATDLTSQTPATNCALLDTILTIDVKGNVGLCCMTSLGSRFEFGNFVGLPLEEIFATRNCQDICGECLKVNVPLYQSGNPWLGVLETFDYPSVPVVRTDRIGGGVDSISLIDGKLVAKGWAADLLVGAAARIELRIDNQPTYRMFPDAPRPDIANRFCNPMLANTGFAMGLTLNFPDSLPSSRLELYSEQVNGDLIRLY